MGIDLDRFNRSMISSAIAVGDSILLTAGSAADPLLKPQDSWPVSPVTSRLS